MKKTFAVVLLVALCAFAVFASGATEAQSGKMKVDLASTYVPNTVIDEAYLKMTSCLNESGLFEATYYNNSQLGNRDDQFENILAGESLIATGGGSDWGDFVGQDFMGIIITPFLYDEITEVYGIIDSEVWQGMLNEAYTEKGIKIFNYPLVSGSRYFMTQKPVVEPGDFAGIKIRVPTSSYYINVFNTFGATPTSIPVAELYTSLAQGTVDACEFPYSDAYTRQLYEVVKYASTTPYNIAFDFFGMSAKVWDSMTAEQQQAMEAAAKAASDYSFEVFARFEPEGKAKLAEKGVKFVDINVDSFRALLPKFYESIGLPQDIRDAVTKAMDDYRAKNK